MIRRYLAHNIHSSRESGAALTEFTIVFPWLFVIILGFVDLCGYLETFRTVSSIAAQGAIRASRLQNLQDNDARVINLLRRLVDEVNSEGTQISGESFAITFDPTTDFIEVSVTAQHDFLFDPINILNASWSPINPSITASANSSHRTSV